MITIAEVTRGLTRSAEGFWRSEGAAPVSYPSHGSDQCFGIEDRSLWFQHRNRAILTTVRSFPPPSGMFLDVGGGNGYVTRALQDAGFTAVLLEPSEAGARNAVARGVEHVICGRTDTVNLGERSMAAIGVFDVVEHVSDDAGFLLTLFRLLQPGGRIYLTVPAGPALWSIDDVEAGHFRRYRRAGIDDLLRTCGFRVDFSSSLFWLLPLPILALRALPTRLGLRKQVTTDDLRSEHQVNEGWARRLAASALWLETSLLEGRRRVPFGSSLLVVATRP